MKPKRYNYSKLFHDLYSFRGFKYREILIKEDVVHIFLRRTRKTATCRNCRRRNRLIGEQYKRTIRDIDLGLKKCYITFFEEKLFCRCGFRGYEELSFVRSHSRCTNRMEELTYEFSKRMTIQDVSEVTDLNWKTVKSIDKHFIRKQISSLEDISPERIGVDEIAYHKGHKYLTIIRDLDLNGVIWIGLKRKKETLDHFFREIGEEKAKNIKVAVIDMWDPFISSIKENCPNVDIVFDKFHVVKKAVEALDEIRKQEFSTASDEERKHMKRKRFVILKRKKNLEEKQKEKLKDLLERNDVLFKSYLLKEQVSDIFDEKEIDVALERLAEWEKNVTESGLKPFKRFVKTMNRYFYGISNYFKHQVTNAGSEGFNTKINIIRRRAYGFWDLEYFILKIHQSCGVMRFDPP